ncbi:MAG: EamA family transporter RarD [Actinomycetes bacterium]
MSQRRQGLVYGLSAYLLWGLFPLYWPLLEPAGPLEILANRIIWSLVVVAVILAATRNWGWLRGVLADRRRMLLLGAAAVTITLNWGTYIYGVNSEQVVQTSLGYFINPLVSILFGVILLHERLRRWQWVAVGLGGAAVLVLTADYGHPPWIALVLALSFGTYGLLKKTLDMGTVESLTVETGLLFLPALAFLVFLQSRGDNTLSQEGPGHAAILVTTGVVTAVPLLFFGAAATRIPLTWIGLLQYIAPVIQFAIGVGLYHEPMPASRWIGFVLVWSALLLIGIESVAFHRSAATRALAPLTE